MSALEEAASNNPSSTKKIKKILSKYKAGSRLDELREFVEFFLLIARNDFSSPLFEKPYSWNHLSLPPQPADEFLLEHRRDNLTYSFQKTQEYVLQHMELMPPSVVKCSILFCEWYMGNHPEVLSLALCRFLLECVHDSDEIKLDLKDFFDESAHLSELHSETPLRLSRTLDLYTRIFQMFSAEEPKVRLRLAKMNALNFINQAKLATDENQKGKHLENALESIFESHSELSIIQKRYDTTDEEIDLVIKNNVMSPFWINLRSPLIFVECKNWSKPVGAIECRNFEVKLRNHNNLTRIGIFVAATGVTKPFRTAMQRMNRDDQLIVVLEEKHLIEFCESASDLPSWLEQYICKFV